MQKPWPVRSGNNSDLPRSGKCVPAGRGHRDGNAFSLIELLCVIAIIGILLSLLMPALFRAYHRVKDMADADEAPTIAHMLRKEAVAYCTANPRFQFTAKNDFEDKCKFAPKCRDWIEDRATEFIPFDYLTPTNLTVLTIHIGRIHKTTYTFTSGELVLRPE